MSADPELDRSRDVVRRHEAEIIALEASQQRFFEREVLYRDLLNALPAAIYTTDADGRINFYNEAAVEFAGRRPALGEMWCVTWKLYHLHGEPMPHDQCPMAVALKERRAVRGTEAIAERPDGSRIVFAPYPTPLFDDEGRLVGAVNMLVDITDRKAAEAKQNLLIHEVNHRANNLLAVVQSIVRLTAGGDVAEFKRRVGGRLDALARTHSLLAHSRWTGADLQKLISEELAPYMGDAAQAWIGGPPLALRPAAAQSLAMVIHELATNAAKYGALSTGAGRVHIAWRQSLDGDLVLQWREEGGPAASPPRRQGVGSSVVRRAAAQLKGRVNYDWAATGLEFELRAPATDVVLGGDMGSRRARS